MTSFLLGAAPAGGGPRQHGDCPLCHVCRNPDAGVEEEPARSFSWLPGAGIFHTLLGKLQLFSAGWNPILAIVLAAAAGSYFYGEEK